MSPKNTTGSFFHFSNPIRALEAKAMTSEDFKGKLVERAELVAEQEELEQFIIQMEPEMYRNFPHIFPSIKSNFTAMQDLQQI